MRSGTTRRIVVLQARAEVQKPFQKAVFETCLRAHDELRTGGAFNAHPDLLVMFAVSDYELSVAESIKQMTRLNGRPLP